MTPEERAKLFRNAHLGWAIDAFFGERGDRLEADIAEEIRAAVEAEREAIAKMIEDHPQHWISPNEPITTATSDTAESAKEKS